MKPSKTVILLLLAPFALTMVPRSGAQTKQSGTAQCKTESEQAIEVGDRPGHALSVSKSKCTWTKPMELGGSQTTEGTSVATTDVLGNRARVHGYHTSTLANGDKFYVRFQGTGAMKEGKPESDQGTWSYTGGSGSLKGLKGQGIYKGKANADGSVTYEVEGEYEIPGKSAGKAAAKKK